jgi:sulfate permease, SulP family
MAIGWTLIRNSSLREPPMSGRASSVVSGVAGSLSKTAAVDRAGGKSQVGGLAAAVLAILAILIAAPALSVLPRTILSAIVIHAVWGLIDIQAVRRYMKIRLNDGISAIVAAVGVLIAGPLLGLLIAIGQSLLGLVYRSSRVDVEILGKVPGEKAAWGGIRQHPERTPVPEILVLRVNVSLFWVNAVEVQNAILEKVDAAEGIKALILDLESTDQMETTSADMLEALGEQLAERNVDLYLVRVRWPVRTVLAHHGLRAKLGEDHMWHSISQAVREARRKHQIERPERLEGQLAGGENDVVVASVDRPEGSAASGRREPDLQPLYAADEVVVAPNMEDG